MMVGGERRNGVLAAICPPMAGRAARRPARRARPRAWPLRPAGDGTAIAALRAPTPARKALLAPIHAVQPGTAEPDPWHLHRLRRVEQGA